MKKIVIATRKSQLAMWQAEFVKTELEKAHKDLEVEFLAIKTRGDILLDSPLSKIGGKGLFVKELEHAMLNNEADIAVHSMKDVPMEFPEGLELGVILERETPTDAFVSNNFKSLEELPQGAIVGTSSLRRQCQLQNLRPDLVIRSLRGNVQTRLGKLDSGEFDAIILASAGLLRLEMESRIAQYLTPEISLPAGGQGAVGIELRSNDAETLALLKPLQHDTTAYRVTAERAMNRRLEGGCQVPIACYAEENNGELWLRGLVGSIDGKQMLTTEYRAPVAEAEALGIRAAEDLLGQGADKILAEVHAQA